MKKDIIKFILLTLVIYNIIPIINKIVPESTNYTFLSDLWIVYPLYSLIISVLFCKKCLDTRAPIAEEYSVPVFKGALSTLWRPILGTAILSFMSGLMLQVTTRQDIPLSTFQQTSLVTQAVVVGALLLPALFVKNRPSLGSVYKGALPLSAAGFLLLPLIWKAF